MAYYLVDLGLTNVRPIYDLPQKSNVQGLSPKETEMKLSALFPHASPDCRKANPQLGLTPKPKSKLQGNVERKKASWVTTGGMNQTEYQFSLRLEAMKRNGEILRYEYEGMTLRWAGMRYTPDFVVFHNNAIAAINGLSFVEVKGGHIWDRDIVRFKGARAHWPEFSFEMWQKTKQGWKRIH